MDLKQENFDFPAMEVISWCRFLCRKRML